MEGVIEYRDSWRGLQVFIPAGWQAQRSGMGLILHDGGGQRAIVAQPRPGASAVDDLEQELLVWLKRFDPRGELRAEPDGQAQTRVCTAHVQATPGNPLIGIFALQMGPAGGFVSGFLAPAATYEADSHLALETLAGLQPIPALSRSLWREPVEGAGLALVPRGWRTEGRISRNALGVPAVSFQAWADDATGVMASAETRLFMEPGLLSGILGSLAGGLMGQGKFVDAATYAEAHLLPTLRAEAPDARIESISARADLVCEAVAREAAASGLLPKDILQGQPSAVEVTFSFQASGLPTRQLSRVVTMRVPPTLSRGMPMWMAGVPFSYRAPAERLSEWQPVLEGVSTSFRVDNEWQKKERARVAPQLSRVLPGQSQAVEMASLLTEVERLFNERSERPLGLHERRFDCCREQPGEADYQMPGLYEETIWRGISARV